jgi:hypothetical protein
VAKILLAVTGSIAAYKAADLASKLNQAGHDVQVVMSEAAQRLVQASTFQNLTGNKVFTDLWDPEGQTRHIALTDEAELAVLAPATANSIGKVALGLADDMVSTTLLALKCKLLVCPAMNTRMWNNPAVKDNLEALRRRGHHVVEPGSGALACGHVGAGRLAEPSHIAAAVESLLKGEPLAAHDFGEGEDGLLTKLSGEWQASGEIEGKWTRQRVSARPLLGHFVRLDVHPNEEAPFAAEVTLGFDSLASRYMLQLLDGSGAARAATGIREGDQIRFEFPIHRATLRWAAIGWDLTLETQEGEGWTLSAEMRLREPM